MNRTLIKALDGLNNLLAIFIILGCTAAGFAGMHQQGGAAIIGAILGLIVGLISAAIVCGLLATLIEIEKHLRAMVSGQVYAEPNAQGWRSASDRAS